MPLKVSVEARHGEPLTHELLPAVGTGRGLLPGLGRGRQLGTMPGGGCQAARQWRAAASWADTGLHRLHERRQFTGWTLLLLGELCSQAVSGRACTPGRRVLALLSLRAACFQFTGRTGQVSRHKTCQGPAAEPGMAPSPAVSTCLRSRWNFLYQNFPLRGLF